MPIKIGKKGVYVQFEFSNINLNETFAILAMNVVYDIIKEVK